MQYYETPVSYMLVPLSDPRRIKYSPLAVNSLCPCKGSKESQPNYNFPTSTVEWNLDFQSEISEISKSCTDSHSPI